MFKNTRVLSDETNATMFVKKLKWLKAVLPKILQQKRSGYLLLLECLIHGSHYYACFSVIEKRRIFVGEPLVLVREPDNIFDYYAIAVFTKAHEKLGYIPRRHNRVIAHLMDQNVTIDAFVEMIIVNAWDPITIKLTMQKPLCN